MSHPLQILFLFLFVFGPAQSPVCVITENGLMFTPSPLHAMSPSGCRGSRPDKRIGVHPPLHDHGETERSHQVEFVWLLSGRVPWQGCGRGVAQLPFLLMIPFTEDCCLTHMDTDVKGTLTGALLERSPEDTDISVHPLDTAISCNLLSPNISDMWPLIRLGICLCL